MKQLLLFLLLAGSTAGAATNNQDLLVKVRADRKDSLVLQAHGWVPAGTRVEDLQFNNWVRVQLPESAANTQTVARIAAHPSVEYVQPNYRIRLLDNPGQARKNARLVPFDQDCPIPIPGFCDDEGGGDGGFPWPGDGDDGDDGGFPFPGLPDEGDGGGSDGGEKSADNPAIPGAGQIGSGADPLLNKQWGMKDIGAEDAWRKSRPQNDMIVAVIDTGVDYTHEDLLPNLWRNAGEQGRDAEGKDKATNGIDDDGNGFIDDVIGWDFVSNDNKPYDLTGPVFNGGNPGHGTHCAGNVAARGENGKGISGVAPTAQIMVLRFLSDKGGGTTADAIKSIQYAVDNGALITSNSWGSEGEDPNDPQGNKALRDIIQYSMDKGTLFIAAAGNGRNGAGYDNDRDRNPAFPASYDHENIVSVAALDNKDALGSFSNWGRKTVDIGAPGVKIFSTVVGGKYTDTVMPILGITWDGTSMATPHVAGAAALYWSAHPEKSWQDVKQAILASAKKIPALRNKAVAEGKLDVKALMGL